MPGSGPGSKIAILVIFGSRARPKMTKMVIFGHFAKMPNLAFLAIFGLRARPKMAVLPKLAPPILGHFGAILAPKWARFGPFGPNLGLGPALRVG